MLDGDLAALLVDEVHPLRGAVEDDAEVGADCGHELLHLTDRLAQERRARIAALGREPVRRDRLHAERPEQQRQHERRGREAVVDNDAEAARADGVDVETPEQVLSVGLAYARRIRDRPDVGEAHPPKLAAREVLLDLLLQRR